METIRRHLTDKLALDITDCDFIGDKRTIDFSLIWNNDFICHGATVEITDTNSLEHIINHSQELVGVFNSIVDSMSNKLQADINRLQGSTEAFQELNNWIGKTIKG